MCLEIVNEIMIRPKNKVVVGYKIFNTHVKKLHGQYIGLKIIPRRRWINEKDYRFERENYILSESVPFKRYPKGFHFYLTKKDAKNNCRMFSEGNVCIEVDLNDSAPI